MTRQEMAFVMLDDGPWQVRRKDVDGLWANALEPSWDWKSFDYRIKPKPNEVWLNENTGIGMSSIAYATKELAEREAAPYANRVAVRYIEAPDQ